MPATRFIPYHLRGRRLFSSAAAQRWVSFVAARCGLLLGLVLALAQAWVGNAAIQFDVFFGYDGMVRDAAWFPVAVEVANDGPSFNAVIELGKATAIGADQVRRVPVELPTNTRKRLVIPVFASGDQAQWTARLLDEKGKVHGLHEGLQPRIVSYNAYLLGALPRSFAGVPVLGQLQVNRQDLQPQVARLQIEQFPDNPIALEGLGGLYLNSEKAPALKANQITALLTWVYEGGHLVVSVEQLAEVNSTPWLQQLLPCELTDVTTVPVDEDMLEWLRKEPPGTPQTSAPSNVASPRRPGTLPRQSRYGPGPPRRPPANIAPDPDLATVDPNFFDAQMAVATGRLKDGEALLSAKGIPLIVRGHRGRGTVTVLTFSPEREPFRSWKHRGLFWLKLLDVRAPGLFYVPYSGLSLDGVFGSLIDTEQVRKLPVEWLLLLLLIYLVVIGPFDQWWLKKINRQMLTWITFPSYVVLFSLLIYFIGYKLRAGETEWNELQVVDVLPRGQRTGLRGRTFVSIYSSGNATYPLAFTPGSKEAAEQSFACLRGELLRGTAGPQETSARVEQRGNVFRAEVFVPVWTSLLYVNDWFQPGALPIRASLTNHQGRLELIAENLLDRPLTEARLVFRNTVFEVGTLPAREEKRIALDLSNGTSLSQWVAQEGSPFESAVLARKAVLGNDSSQRLRNAPLTSMVASFSAQLLQPEHQRNFIAPPGMDLTSLVQRGDAILMAWDAHHTYTEPINRFKPPRLERNTLLRLTIPGPAAANAEEE